MEERDDSSTHSNGFSEVLWLQGQRVGRLTGQVSVLDGPKVVQLPGGFYTEHGILPVGPIAAGLVPKNHKKRKGAEAVEPEHEGGPAEGETIPESAEVQKAALQVSVIKSWLLHYFSINFPWYLCLKVIYK